MMSVTHRRPGALVLLTVGAMFGSFLTDPELWMERFGPMMPAWMAGEATVSRAIPLEHVSALEMAAVLAELTPADFELEVDLSANRVLARGDQRVMDHVTMLVRQLDVPHDVMMPAWIAASSR